MTGPSPALTRHASTHPGPFGYSTSGAKIARMDQPQRRIAPWYVASASMGLIASGLLPVLLPLLVVQVSHRLDFVAYVMGAYNLGLFTAPLLGALAERSQAYRTLFIGGLVALGLSTAGLPLVSHLAPWLVLGIIVGVGTA